MRTTRAILCDALVVLCALVNALLFSLRFCNVLGTSTSKPTGHLYTYIGDDYPEHVPLPSPTFPAKRVFDLEPATFPISGPSAAETWESIHPPGYGFVRMGDQARLLCIAMFHQLHCIEKMRIYLDDPYGAGQWVSWPHQHHCMNYLRQSILCRADRTLEPLDSGLRNELSSQLVERLDGLRDFTSDFVQRMETKTGKAIERQCGDAHALFDFAGSNYIDWKRGWNISSPWDKERIGDEHSHDHGHSHGLKY
ncbi:hypothetical protein ACEPAH_4037 [Sanghuangporus vaninii]